MLALHSNQQEETVNKTNTKAKVTLIEEQKNKERNAALNREWNAIQAEREDHSVTDLDAIIGELIDTPDQHFIESAFNFRDNLDGIQSPHWSERPYLEGFVKKLNPYARHLEKKLRTVLPEKYTNFPGEPDSDLTQLTMDSEEYAYVIGVFMGAKLAGASDEKLQLLRKHLAL